RIHNFLLGGLQNLLEEPLVPKFKVILQRRKSYFAIESRFFAQLRRQQNPSLPIDRHLMRAADDHRLKRLHRRIEARLGSEARDQRIPLIGRIEREAPLSVVREVRDIKTIVIFALQNFAKSGRDTHPPFFIDRMVKPTSKHPDSSPTSHNIPLCPTSVK